MNGSPLLLVETGVQRKWVSQPGFSALSLLLCEKCGCLPPRGVRRRWGAGLSHSSPGRNEGTGHSQPTFPPEVGVGAIPPPTFLCFWGGMIHFLPIILDWIWSGHPKFCNIFRNDSNREQLERGISFLRPLKACHCPAPRLSSPSSVSRRTQTTGRGDLSIVRWSWPDRLVTMM